MALVAMAWIYVVLLMAVVEATGSNCTLLGALFTFLLYGALPLAIVLYLLGSPMRRRPRRRAEVEASAAAQRVDADGGDHAAGAAVTPVGEEP